MFCSANNTVAPVPRSWRSHSADHAEIARHVTHRERSARRRAVKQTFADPSARDGAHKISEQGG
jgi:hypothetical protein